jgi:hypothetical protein
MQIYAHCHSVVFLPKYESRHLQAPMMGDISEGASWFAPCIGKLSLVNARGIH